MTEEENHPHPAPEAPTPAHNDGSPEGCEADWLKWRSRMNRRGRFRQQAPTPREDKGPSNRVPDGAN